MRALLRHLTIGLCCVALGLIFAHSTVGALNHYQDIFVSLSARPLAMGGAGAAVPQTASVFYNPAALSGIRTLTVMWNHSARHFGQSRDTGVERDHLDGDTESIVVPLPLSVYAHGFTAGGEMGYDYRNHPADGSLGFPREFLTGTDSYDTLATSFGLPLAAGYTLRRSFHHFEPAPEEPLTPAWLRLGEGDQWGVYARVLPSLDFGHSEMRHNYDWTIVAPPDSGLPDGFVPLRSRVQSTRTGWALRPTGWLLLATDDVSERYSFRDGASGYDHAAGEYSYFDKDALYGFIHSGDQSRARSHFGGELRVGSLAAYRWGRWDGRPTLGLELNLGGLRLNYAEARDLLPEIVGVDPGSWGGVHIYGAELGFW